MGNRKNEVDLVESSITRQATFSKCLAGVLKEADVLIISLAGQPYVFKSPCHNSMVGHIRNHESRREISPFLLKQARILKSQAKLDRIMKELKREKEHAKVLKKRHQEHIEKRKKIEDMNLEDLIAFKENLEALREKIKGIQIEGETSSTIYVDTLKK